MKSSTKENIRKELEQLIDKGNEICFCEIYREKKEFPESCSEEFKKKAIKYTLNELCFDYQDWYTAALRVMKRLAIDRLEEFKGKYENNRRPNDPMNAGTYSISDYLVGLHIVKNRKRLNFFNTFINGFNLQIAMVKSVFTNLDKTLLDLEGTLQANLFDDQIAAAEELWKNEYLRAAGVVAGVTLESHLKKICSQHGITLRKKNSAIKDYCDKLKDKDVIDIKISRRIQSLSDTRAICAHDAGREPTDEEVCLLIDGVKNIIKTVA